MAEKNCPLMRAPCAEHRCRWYIQLMGKNPQTGADVNEWGCAVEWLPALLIENSQQQRQTGAAVESLRNESVKNGRLVAVALIEVANAAARPAALQDLNPPPGGAIEHKGV